MIVAVCLNPALDVTYEVDGFTTGRSHRATAVCERAGGKGVNVARVLNALGADVMITGFAGGATGEVLRGDLEADCFDVDLIGVSGETRRCVAVVDGSEATVINEPGPVVNRGDWSVLLAATADWAGAEVVVLSGSVPPGAPVDAYAQLIGRAKDHGAKTILDADGEWLRAGLAAGPDLVKPNTAEVEALRGRRIGSLADAVAAARTLVPPAGAAVVSRGEDGLVWTDGRRAVSATSGRRVDGNPTGAGDALAAALALGLATGTAWDDVLGDAVATAAAAVATPVAGSISERVRRAVRPGVTVTELEVPA